MSTTTIHSLTADEVTTGMTLVIGDHPRTIDAVTFDDDAQEYVFRSDDLTYRYGADDTVDALLCEATEDYVNAIAATATAALATNRALVESAAIDAAIGAVDPADFPGLAQHGDLRATVSARIAAVALDEWHAQEEARQERLYASSYGLGL